MSITEIGPTILVAGVTSAAFAASVYTAAHVFFAERAKLRVHYLIKGRAARDSDTEYLVQSAAKGTFSATELERAQHIIEAEMPSLSPRDQSFISEGLHQPSPGGARRYIADVLARAC